MKVNKTYLKLRGFKQTVDLCEEEAHQFNEKTIKKIRVYEIVSGNPGTKKFKSARIEHSIAHYYKRDRLIGRSNFYCFSCQGNGYRVNDQFHITHTKYEDYDIDSALKLVGLLEEKGG